MKLSAQLRIGLVCAIVAVANLVGYLPAIFAHHRIKRQGVVSAQRAFRQRIEPLRRRLPDRGAVGFFQDAETVDDRRMHRSGRLGLMRYAFSPLLIVPNEEHGIVIFDSDVSDSHPPQVDTGEWDLVYDHRDGIKVYRVQGEN